jgi:hypothetical protein
MMKRLAKKELNIMVSEPEAKPTWPSWSCKPEAGLVERWQAKNNRI